MKTHVVWLVLVLLSCATLAQAEQMVYNANDEFSATSNPNGVWTYGTTSFAEVYAGNSIMNTPSNWMTRAEALVNIDTWWSAGFTYDPSVTHNGSGSPITVFGYTWGANDIGLDTYGGASIIQWKAPRAGTVVANATFGASAATAWRGFNGLNVESQANDSGTAWSHTFVVNAGDCIQFATAGAGCVTMFHETVTYIPEPSTIVLLATGLFGLLAYAWRKQK